jgi:hypothetical protein
MPRTPEYLAYGRIPKALLNEPILVSARDDCPTQFLTAVTTSMSKGRTTARRIMDRYKELYPGSSVGTVQIAQLVHIGCAAFEDPAIRLQPGGDAYRLASEPSPLPERKRYLVSTVVYDQVDGYVVAKREKEMTADELAVTMAKKWGR